MKIVTGNILDILQAAIIIKRDVFATMAEYHYKTGATYAHLPIVEAGELGKAEAYKAAAYDMAIMAAWNAPDPKVKLDLELQAERIQKLGCAE